MYQREHSHTNTQLRESGTFDPHCYWRKPMIYRTIKNCVCVFVCVAFIVPLKIFHSYGKVTITGEVLYILIYARHSWSLSSKGSYTRHTYCDTDLPFLIVIFESPWHSHLLPRVWQWSCHYLFLRLMCVAIKPRYPACEACEPPRWLITVNILQLPIQYFFLNLKKMMLVLYCLYVAPWYKKLII